MSEITHEQAVEIDTQLAELWQRAGQAEAQIEMHKRSLASKAGLKGEWGKGIDKGKLVYRETLAEVLDAAHAKLEGDLPGYEREVILRYLDKVTEAQAALKAARDEAAPLEAIYAEHKWQRFFLVQNAGGHIHSSMHCHTCNMRTRFAWLPELSGLTEKEAVEAHGTILCSHCYPSAPVEWTLGIQKEEDPNQCPGSGTYDIKQGTWRRTSYTGSGWGVCTHCNQGQSVTSTGKLRKHKKA